MTSDTLNTYLPLIFSHYFYSWYEKYKMIFTKCNLIMMTHIINLLLKFCLGFGQGVDFVLLCLEIIQGLLMCLLEGFLLLCKLGKALILSCHFFSQVLDLFFVPNKIILYSVSPFETKINLILNQLNLQPYSQWHVSPFPL